MDDTTLIERLRADADRLDDVDVDVDALVRGAVKQGRRRRTRRRIAGAVTGVVAAGVAVAAIAASVPALRGAQEVEPIAPPPSAASIEPTTTPTSTGRVSGSPKQVQAQLTALLPSTLTVTRASSARDEGTNGFGWENSAALTVEDDQGTSYLTVSIGNSGYVDGCFNLADCEQTTLPDGSTLWITRSPSGDKAGTDRTFNYNRPDGGHVSIMERTYAEGNGPVTRDTVPLSDAEGRALVTSTAWDTLFRG